MTKLTTDEAVAQHVKAFADNTADHQNNTQYQVGNTTVLKDEEGNVMVFVKDERILLLETTTEELENGMTARSKMHVNRLNAIVQAMGWEFKLAWLNKRLTALNGSNTFSTLVPNRSYSSRELTNITYS